jgi:hypothetical protein
MLLTSLCERLRFCNLTDSMFCCRRPVKMMSSCSCSCCGGPRFSVIMVMIMMVMFRRGDYLSFGLFAYAGYSLDDRDVFSNRGQRTWLLGTSNGHWPDFCCSLGDSANSLDWKRVMLSDRLSLFACTNHLHRNVLCNPFRFAGLLSTPHRNLADLGFRFRFSAHYWDIPRDWNFCSNNLSFLDDTRLDSDTCDNLRKGLWNATFSATSSSFLQGFHLGNGAANCFFDDTRLNFSTCDNLRKGRWNARFRTTRYSLSPGF